MSHPPGTLAALLGVLESRGQLCRVSARPGFDAAALDVRGLAYDSRRVEPGAVFVAIGGARADGHDFASAAVAAGARALIVEREVPIPPRGTLPGTSLSAAAPEDVPEDVPVPQIVVHSTRRTLATAAAWLHGFPGNGLCIVGITGTDGKTTTSFFVRSVLEAAGMPCGLMGTVETIAGGRRLRGADHVTTPEAPELQRDLAAMLAAGDRAAVVESTSHGLALDRVAEVPYDVAVVTNVTHEHLELHGTVEAYRAAKLRLFELLAVGPANPAKRWGKTGIVNAADRWHGEFAHATVGSGARLIRYDGRFGSGVVHPARAAALGGPSVPEVRLTSLRAEAAGWSAEVATPRWSGPLRVHLAGRFNVENAVAAVAVGEALGIEPGAIREGIAAVAGVHGRMERVETGMPFEVVVDFAHTPQALEIVIDELSRVAAAAGGGVIAVFGSAGERDVVKRRVMGRVAGERCRVVVVTDEDPRREDREAIIEEIAAGAEDAGRRRGHDLLLVPDRAAAIEAAFERARPGDVVLLAGKGHEPMIEMADGPRPWDERAAAEAALARIRSRVT